MWQHLGNKILKDWILRSEQSFGTFLVSGTEFHRLSHGNTKFCHFRSSGNCQFYISGADRRFSKGWVGCKYRQRREGGGGEANVTGPREEGYGL